jgi:hypothetical protein
MKPLVLLLFMLLTLGSCRTDQVDIREEQATLLGYWFATAENAAAAACASGYRIQAESGQYRTQTLPPPFDKATSSELAVRIRYKLVAGDSCQGSSRLIEVITMRER